MIPKPKSNLVDGYATHTPHEYFKGKSFNNAGKWKQGTRYFNDGFIVDIVSYQDSIELPDGTTKTSDVLLACNRSHIADAENRPVIIYDNTFKPIGVRGQLWSYLLSSGSSMTAYEIAVLHGYEGTEEEWIKALQKQIVTSGELKDTIKCAPELDMENVVRYDVKQDKSEAEKAQARQNIGACCEDDIVIAEDPTEVYYAAQRTLDQIALVWMKQQLTESQLKQSQENLHIADEKRVRILEQKVAEFDEKGLTTLGNINDLRNVTWDNHTETEPGTVPPFFVNAINNLVDLLGDPTHDVVKKSGYSTNLVETINYIYRLTGLMIRDVTPAGDTSGRIWYALCDSQGVEVPGSAIFKIPRDNEIHDVAIVEGGISADGKFVDGGTGHWWMRFISGYFDETQMKWIDTDPIYALIDPLFYVAVQEKLPDDPAYEGATIQVKIEPNTLTGFRDVSAKIIEDTVDRAHLNKEGKLNYDFTGYDFSIDPEAEADYYVRCSQNHPDAIRLTPANVQANPDLIDKLVPAYEIGEMYYTWVRHMDTGHELNTEAQTLREAINELTARYPIEIKMYKNDEIDPDDGKTATEGSRYTYVVKQRVDGSDLMDIANIEIPLEYRLLKVVHKVAEGGEPLDYEDDTKVADAGDSLLDFWITNGAVVDPTVDPVEYVIEHLYCEMDVYKVKDEVTGNNIQIHDKDYATPEEVLNDFEGDPQIQLYVSGLDNELSAKILFENDYILGEEIIP